MQLFVNHLSNIDCSCFDSEFGLIGASWIVDVILEGDLDNQGMVMDFGDVKEKIKNIIDDSIDHTLVVASKSSNITITKEQSYCKVQYEFSKGKIEHISPNEAVSLIDVDVLTLQVLEKFLEKLIKDSITDYSLLVKIKLRKEDIQGASYVYSHGLKQHQGNCQRIAHGHRSQIKIMEDGKRSDILEKEWSNLWNGKYLANRVDVKESFVDNEVDYTVFEYSSSQGKFELTIPKICCYLIDNETTIEHLSQHICDALSNKTGNKFKIFAYEGINKGAISYTNASRNR